MSPSTSKFIAFCIALALLTSAPIWGVQYFINQDGSGHVHAAWTMLELLRGDPRTVELYQFNLLTFPNSLGHWMQAASLLFVSPFVSTKLMLSLTYLGLVASVGWLRWCTSTTDGLAVTVLGAAVIGFNWLWLVGAYNFNLGLILAIAATGLYFKWRNKLSIPRILALGCLSVLVFFSHIVAFLILCWAIGILCLCPFDANVRNRIVRTGIAFIPVLLLLFLYAASTEAGGTMAPAWHNIDNPLSISQWITQIRSADSLVLLRRAAFPFVETESGYFIVFAPLVWLVIAIAPLIVSTFHKGGFAERLPFAVLSGGLIAASFFSPDSLQYSSSTGGVIRERLFLAGLLFVFPLFRFEQARRFFKSSALAALSFVLLVQIAGLWEFAIRSDRDAREFFSSTSMIPEGASIAAVTIEPHGNRFVVTHMSSINNYNAIFRDAVAWDNYEFAHYLFPVVAREKRHQEFVMDVTRSNLYDLTAPGSLDRERLVTIDRSLASTSPKIHTLIVWGRYEEIDAIVKRHFAGQPVFENGRVRVFRR